MQSTTSLKRPHSTSFDLVEDKDSKKLKYEDRLSKSGTQMFSGSYLIQKYSSPSLKQNSNEIYR